MSSNQDVYRKVGRGGAGNFYSKPTETDEASKDLEAQHPDPSTQPLASSGATPVPGQYARAGRGGAGNFVDSSTAKEQQSAEENITAKASASAAKPVSRMALGGRGGAGNYHQKQQEAEEAQLEKQRAEEMERKAKAEVDGGLKAPEKVMLAQDRT
ncbi:hypothetical protein CC79DRAFT_1316079 [Sarocladium strictum]